MRQQGSNHTVTQISLSMIKKNKSRSILIAISIFLTTVLLMVIASYGYGLVKWNHVNAPIFYGNYDGSFSGVSPTQLNELELRGEISEIGLAAAAGTVQQSERDMSLMYADDTTLEMTNTDKKLEAGRFPEQAGEIAAQPGFFKKLGYDHPSVGDTVQMSTRQSKSFPFTPETFVISGLIEEDDSQGTSGAYSAFVSFAYCESKIPAEQMTYSAYFRLSDTSGINSDNGDEVIKDLARKCGIDERYASPNSAYLIWSRDPGTETIAGCVLIALMVIVFSVMVIYNIFQTGIAYRVQEYGKIRAIGATRRQMKKIVFREGMLLALAAVPAGVVTGFFVSSLSFDWLIEESMTATMRDGAQDISLLTPITAVLVAAVSALSVWLSLKRPMSIVSKISPVEAMRYQGASQKKNGRRTGGKNIDVRGLTMAGLSNNKKRTVMTILTMGLSCVLFVAMANFAGNMDPEFDARKNIPHGQFQLELEYDLRDTAYPQNNLDQILKSNPLNGELIEQIRQIPDVTSVRTQHMLAGYLRGGSSEDAADADGRELTSVVVLDREDFEREKENGSYIGTIDYDQASEENAILYGWSHFLDESGFDIGDTVNITLQSGDQSREVSLPLAGAFGNTEGSWAITEDTYRNLGFSGDSTGIIWVDCEQKDTESVQTALYNLTSGTEHLEMRSYTESLNTVNMGMKMMKLFSYGLTALIAFISFMNMANTMITGIVTRKQEFGVLQAIGMTNRQLNKMLREEGLFFSLGTVVISLLLGLPLGYGLFLYGKNHSWMGLDEYTVPLTEILVMIVALAALQLILSWILSRNVKKESLVERIRYQG